MKPPVVIFACGNPSRGDDALGPVLLDRLQAWLDAEGLADGFELIGDFQLQIEHALDLVGRRLAVFIDAGSNSRAPFVFRKITARDMMTHSTHALSPESVLAVFPRICDETPPTAFVLCVLGETFELGEGLSQSAQAHADASFELLKHMCCHPHAEVWQEASACRVAD
jgi:hydrogenase maturation protease